MQDLLLHLKHVTEEVPLAAGPSELAFIPLGMQSRGL
jgi:hypothetical protein